MSQAAAAQNDFGGLQEVDKKILADLELYADKLVTIKPKEGPIIGPGHYGSFKLNRAQRYVHQRIEEQLHRKGYVRVLILKGRQLGISTYVGIRFYKGTTTKSGQRCYILTHEDPATQNLFAMAKLIHEHMPTDYQASATSNNLYSLDFGKLNGGYRVGTAQGVGGGGRSSTIQRFHGSECAFWANPDKYYSGVIQGVPMAPHTEIILESTANGIGGKFYDEWQLAEKGEGLYEAIFCPWFWGDEYRMATDGGNQYTKSSDEIEYQHVYDLDDSQMRWAHFKNIELGGSPGEFGWMFRQEYPANAVEAFQTSGDESFIKPEYVMAARKNDVADQSYAPVILGVDVARSNKEKDKAADRSRIFSRQGRKAGDAWDETIQTDDLVVLANAVARAIDATGARMTFIDVTGVGGGAYDELKRLNYGNKIRGINFGSRADLEDKYQNKRSEMWSEMKIWLMDPAGVDIPDDPVLHKEICGPMTGPENYDANSRFKMEKKREIIKRLKFSPDGGDALALTFAAVVRIPREGEELADWEKKRRAGGTGRTWMAS